MLLVEEARQRSVRLACRAAASGCQWWGGSLSIKTVGRTVNLTERRTGDQDLTVRRTGNLKTGGTGDSAAS